MPGKKRETRGLPPSRPYPSQLMHLLELTRLDIETVANAAHVSPKKLNEWMTFNVPDAMPTAIWLLLNMYTLAVKNICLPDGMEEYIRETFPNAFAEEIKPLRHPKIPARPATPSVTDIVDMLAEADCQLDECASLTFTAKGKTRSWIDPNDKPSKGIPFGVYELLVMTLWAQGRITPTEDMSTYLSSKYNYVFAPVTNNDAV